MEKYDETLVALYQLRDQLDVEDCIALAECREYNPLERFVEGCLDCGKMAEVYVGKFQFCRYCALDRLRVRRKLRAAGGEA